MKVNSGEAWVWDREIYDDLKGFTEPSQLSSAVTRDILRVMQLRHSEDDIEFDSEMERTKLRLPLHMVHIRIYRFQKNHCGCLSDVANISAKRAEADAVLAAKTAEVELQMSTDVVR